MNEDIIKSEILQGLIQVDETFMINSFDFAYDSKTRTINVAFVATTAKGEEVSGVNKWH